MKIQKLFKLIKSLTSQTNIQDAIATFQALLDEHFQHVKFTAYEIQTSRNEDQKTTDLVCIDCELIKPVLVLQEHEYLLTAYNEAKAISCTHNGVYSSIYPVVLYDKSISHLLILDIQNDQVADKELIFGLVDIFSDIFRNIHEKGYDPLTRILNRQAFDRTATELSYSSRFNDSLEKRYKAIAILDIDNFKKINDSFGHAIGDEILVLFAQTIRSVLRQEDLFFRYGGEEFVILVTGVEQEQAQHVLDRCRDAIASRHFPQVEKVTVSIGFADIDERFHLVDNLLKADKALYFIKSDGKNKTLSYEHLLADGLLEPVVIQEGAFDFWE